MKKLFILSLASLGFVACGERADYIVLSGKIDSYNGLPLKITGSDFKSDLHINQDGTFNPRPYAQSQSSACRRPRLRQPAPSVQRTCKRSRQKSGRTSGSSFPGAYRCAPRCVRSGTLMGIRRMSRSGKVPRVASN